MNALDFFPGWLSRCDIISADMAWDDEIEYSDIPMQMESAIFYWVVLQYDLDRYGCLDSELLC